MQLIHLIELIKKISSIDPDLTKNRETNQMIGLRNLATHDYMAIDMHIVWKVIKEYLPDLKITLSKHI